MAIRDIFKRKERSFFPEEGFTLVSSGISWENNATVAACKNKIANTLSVLPMQLYIHTKKGKQRATWHPLYRILEDPAVEESATLFYRKVVDEVLDGNCYIYKLKKGDQLVGLQICDSKKFRVYRDETYRKVFECQGRIYTESEILHIPYPGIEYNGTVGVGPAQAHRSIIELDNKLHEYIECYFDNSLGSRYALKPGASYNQKTTDIGKFYATFMPSVRKFVQGQKNAGGIMIPPPDTDFQELRQPSNAEGELHGLLRMVEAEICHAFNVPPEILDSEAQKYGSLEQKQNDFLSNCIQPLGDHICKCFERLIEDNPTHALYLQYEYKNLLTTDTATLIDYLVKEVQGGLMSPNEARSKLGLPDIGPEGDFHFLNSALMPLTEENIEAYMAKAKLQIQAAVDGDHSPIGDDKA